VSLQSVWDVVSSVSWMHHGSQELKIVDLLEDTSEILVKEVESLLLNELSGDLKGDLISPKVDKWHGHVVKEDSHLLSTWWSKDSGLLLLNFSLDGVLEVLWLGSTGEVDSLLEHLRCIKLVAVHDDHRGLGSTRGSNQEGVKHSWLLSDVGSDWVQASNLVDDEFSSAGIGSWDKELREDDSLWSTPVLWLPEFPLLGSVVIEVVEDGLLVQDVSTLSLGLWKWSTS